MHQLFFPLDQRQYMLLLTTMTAGGSESVALFKYLPDDEQKLLFEKADILKKIPTGQRVSFMVREMKEELQIMGQRGIEFVDPSWVLSVIKGESPRVVAALLVGLPPPMVRGIIEKLPDKVRGSLPSKDDIEALPGEITRAVRYIIEQKFATMPRLLGKQFHFRSVTMLDRHDIHLMVRALGTDELAQAFISVGKRALGELCRRLPKDNAEELINAVKLVDRSDAMDLKSAQRFLARILLDFKDTEELFQKAGLFRLAKAAQLEDMTFHKAFMQRVPKPAGVLYMEYVEKAGDIAEWDKTVLQRVQDRIMQKIQELSAAGTISKRYASMSFALHNPAPASPPTAAPPEAGQPKPSDQPKSG
jgi:hypothetical protein